MKKTVYLDMDNTLVDFLSAFARLDPACTTRDTEMDDIPGIFALMDPMPGAIEAVHELAPLFDVYVLSTAPWDNPSAWHDKVAWIRTTSAPAGQPPVQAADPVAPQEPEPRRVPGRRPPAQERCRAIPRVRRRGHPLRPGRHPQDMARGRRLPEGARMSTQRRPDGRAVPRRARRPGRTGAGDRRDRPPRPGSTSWTSTYIGHPAAVAARFDPMEQTLECCAAWLHDVIEDSQDIDADLLAQAGVHAEVIEVVELLTRRTGDGDDYYRRIAAHPAAKAVKLSDIRHNTDPDRTRQLSDETRERLAEKYGHALDLLGEHHVPDA